ncbi:MAG: DUF2341 domain-containing protein [Bacteroidales bacterium]|jgi:hypothetical protein|nr:DUF2341 domain-containing protein [Bacteroidales bacterium]
MRASKSFLNMTSGMITLLLLLFSAHDIAAQNWYDNDWPFRRIVSVPNPSGADLADFQVQINLTEGLNFEFGRCLSDGSDIRIASADGTTLIPFWIEEWTAGVSASVWIKVPLLPASGTSVMVYYGNPSPEMPTQDPVETPPVGPFTRAVGNPVVPAGATGTSLLAENIVYDPVSGHYWMCLANYSQSCISLCWSDTPTDPSSWTWGGNVVTTFTTFYSGAPHLMFHDGLWYLFYADRPNIEVATATNIEGPYTIQPTPVLQPSAPTGAWDSFRVDEPYVFQRNDGKWVLVYMGDAGSVTEQIGYATADDILGPYTPYASNPCLAFGPPGSFDAGTVADPWVYEYHGVYYIGYTVSPTKTSPWYTACATTSDWEEFTKIGIILPLGTGLDAANSFRGALTRIGDEYVFSYTNDGYRMAIATQPVYSVPENMFNNPDAVFDFYDGFDDDVLNTSKWSVSNGQTSQAMIAGGMLTLHSLSTSGYIRITGTTPFGMNYIGETRARHPDQGTVNMIAEVGFATTDWATVRIVDDFMLGTTYWQRQAKLLGQTDAANPFYNMAQQADQDWHLFRVFREGTNTAGYQIDDNPIETTTENVPTNNLPPFLMSYGTDNDMLVDWTRVRKWAGSDPLLTAGSEEHHTTEWTGSVSSDWDAGSNWTAGVPGAGSAIIIPGGTNSTVFGGNLSINPSAILSLESGGSLTVTGDLSCNGILTVGSTLETSGSLIVNGTTTGNITYNRQLKTGVSAGSDWHLAAPPVTSNSESNTGKITATYQWSELTGTWTTTGITSAIAGRGYNIRQETGSDGEISFTGPLANGDVTVEASSPYADAVSGDASYFTRAIASGRSLENPGGRGWNLLGNPYPSAINASAFISANYSATPSLSQFDPNYVALYLFDGTDRQYYYIANSTGWPSGNELSETHIQAGQGFFVLAMNDNSVFRFTKAMQEHSAATAMLKSGSTDDPWPGLQLKAKHPGGEVVTTVVYNGSMTTGVDPGYDIGLFKSGQELEIYTSLALRDNGINYTRQALPLSGADTLFIPVGIDYKKGGEVIFSATTIPVEDRRLWLEDRVTGIFTDLSLRNYTVTIPANTYGTGRFFIIASTNTPTSIDRPGADAGELRIWISGGRLVIKGLVTGGSLCELFDIQGRKLMEESLSDGELNTIELPAGLSGVVVVKVTNGNVIETRKLAIHQGHS